MSDLKDWILKELAYLQGDAKLGGKIRLLEPSPGFPIK